MEVEWVREFCLSLPHTTEHVQWEIDLVFKVGGKMFAVIATEPARVWMSMKCGDEEFAELIERPGVIPAPYLARAKWVALESEESLPRDEVERLLRAAHDIVFAKLPKKVQAQLNRPSSSRKKRRSIRQGLKPLTKGKL
ncbi:MAG TPA: MmcQ/YjbR family DNA-binding protein [Candidatus Acidoferrum sp.]|nr:MmcQ/YjbR family DNA-binding protein [Candidatus Acidoferrum sp.]